MRLFHYIRRITNRLRYEFFPTQHEITVNKYFADGGDRAMRYDYDLTEESVVFDVGGYQGQWTSDIYSMYTCNVFIFEPVPSFVQAIRKRFVRNKKIHVVAAGLGAASRTEKIHVADAASSLYASSQVTETVDIVSIHEFLKERQVRLIDLMKINIEGGEYELLESIIDRRLIDRIQNVQIQFHEISKESCDRMLNIRGLLKKTHFPTYIYDFVWENWTRLQ